MLPAGWWCCCFWLRLADGHKRHVSEEHTADRMGCPYCREPLSLGTTRRAWPSDSSSLAPLLEGSVLFSQTEVWLQWESCFLVAGWSADRAHGGCPALSKEGLCPQPLVWLPGSSSLLGPSYRGTPTGLCHSHTVPLSYLDHIKGAE